MSSYYVPDTVLGTAVNRQIQMLELEELMFVRGWEREPDGKINKNNI